MKFLFSGSLKVRKPIQNTIRERLPRPKAACTHKGITMNDQTTDDFDNLDALFENFDGVTVEGGVDSENDDGCEGGACKI